MLVKLLVLFLCFDIVLTSDNYCGVCPNHTFCKYTMPGPSTTCKEYDEAGSLTRDDIVKIVNRINERRNFVARGLAKQLAHAANMKKIHWSEEVAAFAQRWVDQCDSATRPDSEDECRDLADTKVGQNIASVTGPTPGMHIQSLIDVWFTMGLDYRGSASYYNSSRDSKTNYFTQLIWAETDRVGCGRARFYAAGMVIFLHDLKKESVQYVQGSCIYIVPMWVDVESKKTIIERLVCNFAPKGNNHGKPVYSIGYPATQCPRNMTADKEFNGLCTHFFLNKYLRKFTPINPPVSSLLRILNLSNNSAKQEIDPVRNNLRQVKSDHNLTKEQRNQKTRHVFLNNSYVAMKNIPPMPMYNKWRNPVNMSRNQRNQQYQQERGHSRVYHGHDLHENNFRSEMKPTASQNFRKFDFSTETYTAATENESYRKNYQSNECTRNNVQTPVVPEIKNDGTVCDPRTNICSRRQNSMNKCVQIVTPFPPPSIAEVYFQNVNPNLCPCIPTTTCAPPPPRCQCNINCQCLKTDCSPTFCPPGLRRNNDEKAGATTSSEFHYYDLLPKMAIRSGESDSRRFHSKDVIFAPSSRDPWIHSTTMGNIFKHFSHAIQENNQDNAKDFIPYENRNKPDSDYIYDSSDSRERKRRCPADEMTFKPFWQMDEFNNQRPGQLKSIKYTTLPKTKTKRITTRKRVPQTTEIITVNLKDGSNTIQLRKNAVTEKYLSFDELMHLRKFGSTDTSTIIDARRSGNETTTKGTSEYTTNTPYKRKKYCTRKLTCTWTAVTITDANGSVIDGGGAGERGSRTPPGYVDGCTRTSTCTRDYMDRNKFSTIRDDDDDSGIATGSGGGQQEGDEDYCEKRALNVHRRDSNKESPSYLNADIFTTSSFLMSDNIKHTYMSSEIFTTPAPTENCLCLENNQRIKRNEDEELILLDKDTLEGNKEKRYSHKVISYGNLYYLVLQKIIDTWKKQHSSNHINPCLCNASSVLIKGSIIFITFIFLYNIVLNYYR